MRIHTTHTRDAALTTLRRANRWMIAGSIALTGVLADVAANAFPGKTLKSSASSSRPRTRAGSSSATQTESFHPPERAPQASGEAPESSGAQGAQESSPSPEQGSPPAQESPPSQESAPAQEPAPEGSGSAQEPSPPVVSGGS